MVKWIYKLLSIYIYIYNENSYSKILKMYKFTGYIVESSLYTYIYTYVHICIYMLGARKILKDLSLRKK